MPWMGQKAGMQTRLIWKEEESFCPSKTWSWPTEYSCGQEYLQQGNAQRCINFCSGELGTWTGRRTLVPWRSNLQWTAQNTHSLCHTCSQKRMSHANWALPLPIHTPRQSKEMDTLMGSDCQGIGVWASQTKSQHGGREVLPTKEQSPQCTFQVLIDFT